MIRMIIMIVIKVYGFNVGRALLAIGVAFGQYSSRGVECGFFWKSVMYCAGCLGSGAHGLMVS